GNDVAVGAEDRRAPRHLVEEGSDAGRGCPFRQPLVSLYRRSEDFGQWLHRLDASDVRAGQHSAHADGAELPCDGICLASALWSQRSELVVVVPLPTVTGRTVSDQMDGRVGDGACGV